jgi:hypothetical protein
MEINDKIQTLQKSRWWDKGDIGRIVHKTYDSHDSVVYLVCFDSTCHKMHDRNGEHVWYLRPHECTLYRPNRLMKVE